MQTSGAKETQIDLSDDAAKTRVYEDALVDRYLLGRSLSGVDRKEARQIIKRRAAEAIASEPRS